MNRKFFGKTLELTVIKSLEKGFGVLGGGLVVSLDFPMDVPHEGSWYVSQKKKKNTPKETKSWVPEQIKPFASEF